MGKVLCKVLDDRKRKRHGYKTGSGVDPVTVNFMCQPDWAKRYPGHW